MLRGSLNPPDWRCPNWSSPASLPALFSHLDSCTVLFALGCNGQVFRAVQGKARQTVTPEPNPETGEDRGLRLGLP